MTTNRNNKPRKKITGRLSRTGVDLNEARNAALDAVAEMREMTIKHGRPLASRYSDSKPGRKRGA